MEMTRSMSLILLCYFVVIQIIGTSSQQIDEKDAAENNSTTMCELKLTQRKYIKLLGQETRLLYITLNFKNGPDVPQAVRDNSSLYLPLRWKRTSGKQGKGILQLRPNYDILSLYFLSFDTVEISIEAEVSPTNCMKDMGANEYESAIVNFLFKYTHDKEKDEICNMHIVNDEGFAEFHHRCCLFNNNNELECHMVTQNAWITGIDYCSYIVIILVLLYFPVLIPKSFYETLKPTLFEYYPAVNVVRVSVNRRDVKSDTASPEKQKLNDHKGNDDIIVCTKFSAERDSLSFVPRSVVNDKNMRPDEKLDEKLFKTKIDKKDCVDWLPLKGTVIEEKYIYEHDWSNFIGKTAYICRVLLSVPSENTISSFEVPTGLLSSLNDAFFQCKIRKNSNVKECCHANLFPECCCGLKWWILLRLFVKAIMVIFACSPWLIRVLIFYIYEQPVREHRNEAARALGLYIPLHYNVTYYLTPIHALFISSYFLVAVAFVALKITDKIKYKFKVKNLVNDFLKDFRSLSKKLPPGIKKTIRCLLKPFEKLGILGLIVAPILWIPILLVIILMASLFLFPAFLFILHFGFEFWQIIVSYVQPKTQQENQSRTLKLIVLVFVLLAISSFVLLVMECVIFLVEIATYTLIGLILNSSHAMQYVSVISLCLLYYGNCFGRMNEKYLKYNKAVHQILYKTFKIELNDVASKEKSNENDAKADNRDCTRGNDCFGAAIKASLKKEEFQREQNGQFTGKEHPEYKLTKDRKINFFSDGLVMFLDRHNTFYISKNFFFDVCDIDDVCPGPLSKNIKEASTRFMALVIFLFFVFLVIMGLGDENGVSFTNQLFATVAGGFVPWVLMKADILFPTKNELSVDEIVKKYFTELPKTNGLSQTTEMQDRHINAGGQDKQKPTAGQDGNKSQTSTVINISDSFMTEQNSAIHTGNHFRKRFEDKLRKQWTFFNVVDMDIKPSDGECCKAI